MDIFRPASIGLIALLLALSRAAAAQAPASSPPADQPPAQGAQPATATENQSPGAVPASAVTSSPASTTAPTPAQKAPALKRQLYTWASVGTTFAYGQTYGSANVGAGWLLQHGIAPNVEVGYAFGNSPTLWSIRPGLTWFLPVPVLSPYLGAHYTHWIVSGTQPDQNGIGGRAGVSLGQVLSVGVSYDHALGCSQNCDSWTPTISAGVSL